MPFVAGRLRHRLLVLSYLTRLPLDELKIDRSFVTPLQQSGAPTEIVRAVVAMAGALGLRVVAEGIETEEQRAALVALGCTRGQGFLFSAPVAADAFAADWLGPA